MSCDSPTKVGGRPLAFSKDTCGFYIVLSPAHPLLLCNNWYSVNDWIEMIPPPMVWLLCCWETSGFLSAPQWCLRNVGDFCKEKNKAGTHKKSTTSDSVANWMVEYFPFEFPCHLTSDDEFLTQVDKFCPVWEDKYISLSQCFTSLVLLSLTSFYVHTCPRLSGLIPERALCWAS